uniref:Putative DNA binding, helix-turn-helix domain containing protein n=1 Tax=viral metagenome TaxID=1070528 RepID=A0A6M3IYZ3_9ZZZZ
MEWILVMVLAIALGGSVGYTIWEERSSDRRWKAAVTETSRVSEWGRRLQSDNDILSNKARELRSEIDKANEALSEQGRRLRKAELDASRYQEQAYNAERKYEAESERARGLAIYGHGTDTSYISAQEAAEILGVTPRTVRRWAQAGRIPSYTVNRRVMLDKNSVWLMTPVVEVSEAAEPATDSITVTIAEGSA